MKELVHVTFFVFELFYKCLPNFCILTFLSSAIILLLVVSLLFFPFSFFFILLLNTQPSLIPNGILILHCTFQALYSSHEQKQNHL